MASNFEAYHLHVVLQSLQKKIEAVEAWGHSVLAGLSDGTLMILEPDAANSAAPYQVVKAMRAFGKSCIYQLQYWAERQLLLSLDDDGVRLHRLPAFKIQCQANRSRYAQCFAFQPDTAMLAVGVKKRLLLYHFNGNEFVELKDVSMTDNASCMSWIGKYICVGHRKEYVLVDVESGKVSDLFKSSAICMTKAEEELLVAKGNVGVFLGSSGRVTRRSSLVFSDSPVAMAFSQPYAIAFLPSYIEIRSLNRDSSGAPAQVLHQKGLTSASWNLLEGGAILTASGAQGGLQRLQPVAFKEQAETLAQLGEYEEALELAAFVPDSQVSNLLRIHLGHHEFAEGHFDEAMAQFGQCSNASPVLLLNLFPSLASREMLQPLQATVKEYNLPQTKEPKGEDFQHAVDVLLPYLITHRGRLASHRQEASKVPGSPGSASLTGSETDLDEASHARSYMMDLTDEQCIQLQQAIDTAILKAMLATSDSGALLRFVQGPHQADLKEGEAALKARGRYAELVALYKSRGEHAAALNILKSVSQQHDLEVAPQGAAAELAGVTGVWAAVRYLVSLGPEHTDLMKRHTRWILKADPEAALDMFVQISQILPPAGVLPLLHAQAPNLCAHYLESCLESGAASHAEFDQELAGIYLRAALADPAVAQRQAPDQSDAAQGPDEPGQGQGVPGSGDARNGGANVLSGSESLDRLKQLVLGSQYVDPQRLLVMLPSDALYDLRAVLLEKLGMYKKALRLYVHTMNSPGLAEAYCDRLYQASAKPQGQGSLASFGSSSNYEMYMTLIQVFLETDDEGKTEKNPESSNWNNVAQLLARKHNIIDPSVALDVVPDQIPLSTMLAYLESSLRSASQQVRSASIVKSLRRSENFHVKEENVKCKDRSFEVTFERACSICHRRIGTAAFVAYSQNVLAHYSCHTRKSSK